MTDRDNITRTRAKDPWGREAEAFRTAAHGRTGSLGHRPRHFAVTEVCEGWRQTERLSGYAGSRLNRDAVQAGPV